MSGLFRIVGATALALLGAATAGAQDTAAPRLLDPMFADHAVLQRGRAIAVWGEAAPGAAVTITLGTNRASATAGPDGTWRASLPAMGAGGPYVLAAQSGDQALAVQDVLIGDVFLCSGQSNMEWPVSSADHGADEVAQSADPGIRLLTVPQRASPLPVKRLAAPAAWQVAGPDTAADFSAVCLFMAQTLRLHSKVPFGLIDNSWGGSAISAWLDGAAYLATGGDPQALAALRLSGTDPAAANRQWGTNWQNWWAAHNKDPSLTAPWMPDAPLDAGWQAVPSLGRWSSWNMPALANWSGMMWYRTSVRLTAAQAAQAATLSLGPVDDTDETWVNGHPVGSTTGAFAPRRYALPAGTLVPGDNVVVVNDFNAWGDGGIYGPPAARAFILADGTRVPLDGLWSYRQASEMHDAPPHSPWDAIAGISTIDNGMVVPLGGYGIKAVAWYQGESDTGQGTRYAPKLQALIAQWRTRFGRDLPVAVVQLPDFGKVAPLPQRSDWANLREAQREAVEADPHAALVVTIDLGDPDNLHPTNKRPVGARLARAMERVAYESTQTASGPTPLGARRDGDRILVDFANIEGQLQSNGAPGPFVLCGDSEASCHLATGTLQGASVILPGDPTATRIRYCWADSPTCTLHDAGLPAGPFELKLQ